MYPLIYSMWKEFTRNKLEFIERRITSPKLMRIFGWIRNYSELVHSIMGATRRDVRVRTPYLTNEWRTTVAKYRMNFDAESSSDSPIRFQVTLARWFKVEKKVVRDVASKFLWSFRFDSRWFLLILLIQNSNSCKKCLKTLHCQIRWLEDVLDVPERTTNDRI